MATMWDMYFWFYKERYLLHTVVDNKSLVLKIPSTGQFHRLLWILFIETSLTLSYVWLDNPQIALRRVNPFAIYRETELGIGARHTTSLLKLIS